MQLFKSERQVMEVIWREGSISAGQIARILAIDIGWNRNTTYTVINKCIKKGYITRGEHNFICTAVKTKEDIQKEEIMELLKNYFDNSPVKMFNTLTKMSQKQDLKKMKKILKSLE